MKPGGLFGEVALFDARPRSATVSADGPVKLAVIPAEALNALIDERPEMGVLILRNLGRVLCERLRSSNFQVEAIILAL
jgi:CRP-like cAMP-binding protein